MACGVWVYSERLLVELQLQVAKDVRVSGNIGFQGSTGDQYADQPLPGHEFSNPWPGAGWLRLLGDDVQPWSRSQADRPAQRDAADGPTQGDGRFPPVNRSAMRGCMDYHTWTADRVRVRNLIGRLETVEAGSRSPVEPGGATPVLTRANRTIDGDAVFEWSQAGHASTSVILGELDLNANPSVLNRSVFLALDTRLRKSRTRAI